MNIRKFLFASFVLSFALAFTAYAQEKMTTEQWQNEMSLLTNRKASLTKDIASLQTEIADLKAQYVKIQSPEDCRKEVHALLGVTSKTELDNYGNLVNALDAKIDNKQASKEDLQAELNQLKNNRATADPLYYDKVENQLQRKLDAIEQQKKEEQKLAEEKMEYTVKKGDCLWNIAKKKEYYSNPFAWPKIYSANRDQIKNPDLIYPKQIFKIPNLTDEEKNHYDKVKRNFKPAPPKQEQAAK